MKKTLILLTALMLTIAAEAQTLSITTASGTTSYHAADLTSSTPVTFSNGAAMTVGSDTYAISDINHAVAGDIKDNEVHIIYNGTSAAVLMAVNVTSHVTATISGAHVNIAQSNTDAVDGDEITYVLSGTTTDGSFTLGGSYKCTVSLAGITMTNPSGAAVNITNSKRIQLSAKKNTTNTLTDGSGSQKACIYSKGQLQLQGNGILNVAAHCKHAIKSASYIQIKNLTLNITAAAGDGLNCEEYLQMKSGSVTISGVSDDGIQCDLGGTTATGETTDHEDEDSGNIYLEGGTLNITTAAAAAKGIKCEGDLTISDGTVTIAVSGSAAWDSEDAEVKGSTCLSADGNMTISGGAVTLTNTGAGGKGIKADGTLTISNNANLTVTASGQIAYCNSASDTSIRTTTSSSAVERLDDTLKASPKAIKADNGITVSGGSVYAKSTYHEGIESKSTLTISGGYIYAEAGDDAMNASGDFTITGGYVYGNSTGNDGLDANGNFYIQGGNVVAVSNRSPEVGIDANTEGGKKLYITGGNVVAIGGFESGASITGGTAKSVSSFTKGSWYGLTNGSTAAFAFKIPNNNSMGTTMAVYTTGEPALNKDITATGTSIWSGYGNTAFSGGSSVTLSNYSSGGGPGGGRW